MRYIIVAFVFFLMSTDGVASPFREGVHYIEVDNTVEKTPSIMLFHSPYCGPCAMIHEPIVQLVSSKQLNIQEIVVAMGQVGTDIQHGYVVARRNNKAHDYIKALIRRIHFTKDQAPKSRQDISKVLMDCGVETDEFDENSQCMKDEVEELNRLVSQYRIWQTPTIIVNGNKQIVLASLKTMDELKALIMDLYNG